jgi:hypothetical protein
MSAARYILCLVLTIGALCGCSTVQPELTREDRLNNHQLIEQGEAHEPSSRDDMTTVQKVGSYAVWPAMWALEFLAATHYSFSP